MKIKKLISAKIVMLFLFTIFGIINVAKAEATGQLEIIANLEIYEAKIVSQDDNSFNIEFILENTKNVQPDIFYGAVLSEGNGSNPLVDEYVYDKRLTIGNGESKREAITYEAPEFLKGSYNLKIFAKNSSGLLLAVADLGEVELTGSGEFINIENESCILSTKNNSRSMFSGNEFFNPGEVVYFDCRIESKIGDEKEFLFSADVYEATTFTRDIVSTYKGEKENIETEESKRAEVEIEIPQGVDSQFFEGIAYVTDNKGETISNKVKFNFVVEGSDVVIDNLTIDKESYAANEEANVSVAWSVFSEENLSQEFSLKVALMDEGGSFCNDNNLTYPDVNVSGKRSDIVVKINKECKEPSIQASVLSSSGKELFTKKVSMNEKMTKRSGELVKNNEFTKETIFSNIFFWIFVSIPLIVALMLIYKKRKGGSLLFFLLLVFSIPFISLDSIEAATGYYKATITNPWYYLDGELPTISTATIIVTAGTDKSSYDVSEAVRVNVATSKRSGTGSGNCTTDTTGTLDVSYMDSTGSQTRRLYSSRNIGNSYSTNFSFLPYNSNQNYAISFPVNLRCNYASATISGSSNALSLYYSVTGASASPGPSCTWDPLPSEWCSGEEFIQFGNPYMDCGERMAIGTKDCSAPPPPPLPTCSFSFSPSTGLTAPADVYFSWNSTDATSASYNCSGPFTGSGILTRSGSAAFYGLSSGSQSCTMTVNNVSGSGTCSDNVLIGASCTNECTLGQKECNLENSRVCGNYDADSCLEWSSWTADTLTNYSCSVIPSVDCSDEANCEKDGVNNANCFAENSCGDAIPRSDLECRNEGISSCVDENFTCDSCPNVGSGNYREVAP